MCVEHLPGTTCMCVGTFTWNYMCRPSYKEPSPSLVTISWLCVFLVTLKMDVQGMWVGSGLCRSLASLRYNQHLRINPHQSESINTNQHQSEPITIRINQHQSDQNQSASSDNYVLMSLSIKKEICIYWHKCSKLSILA